MIAAGAVRLVILIATHLSVTMYDTGDVRWEIVYYWGELYRYFLR